MISPDLPRWFHVTAHTYGSWLYGDPRGFRTRYHREHVEGDYKNPPPRGRYAAEYARSKGLLKQEPVRLTPLWRGVVGPALRWRLAGLGAEVIAVAVSATHAHILAKMPPSEPRAWVGLAKKHAWFLARDLGWVGHLWGKRSRAEPVKDRDHQVKTFLYILKHARTEGAWVWSFRDEVTSAPPSDAEPSDSTSPLSPPIAIGGL